MSDASGSAPSTRSAAPDAGTRLGDRSLPMLITAGALVVAVVGAVLVFGVDRPPPVEPLGPDAAFVPPAAIAWTAWDGSEHCVYVGEPNGEVRELTCGHRGDELVGWTDDGILVVAWSQDESLLVAIDPDSGERAPVGSAMDRASAPATPLWTDREDGTLRVSVGEPGERTVVWEVRAPGTYDVVRALAAPDGTAVAMTDIAGRLLVAPAGGAVAPQQWSDGVERYGGLVWEGTGPAV